MGRQGIRDAYETGRGSIKVRAVSQIEEGSNGRSKIVVTELPYQVNKARLAEKIADLVKSGRVKDIADIKDHSSGREGMRLVVDLKRYANPQVVLNQLYKHTQLQDNFGVIMLALVDGVPRTLNLAEMVGYYVDHQVDVVTRRTRFELRKAEERDHIVLGLLIALDHLDEVIKIIRASQDADAARKKLMTKFKLTEIQANHILDMPLRRLTRLARAELDAEHAKLLADIKHFNALLKDPKKLRAVDQGRARRAPQEARQRPPNEDPRRRGRLRHRGSDRRGRRDHHGQPGRLREAAAGRRVQAPGAGRQGRAWPEPEGRGRRQARVHDDDPPLDALLHDEGRVYRVKAHEIPEVGRTARGLYAANLPGVALDGDERISAVIDLKEYTEGEFLLFATRKGIVKKTALPEYDSPRTGLIAINLRSGDELIDVKLTEGKDEVFLVSRAGQAIRFKESLVRPMGRATGGVIGMRVAEDDRVISVGLASEGEEMISVSEHGYGKRSPLKDYPTKGRAAARASSGTSSPTRPARWPAPTSDPRTSTCS